MSPGTLRHVAPPFALGTVALLLVACSPGITGVGDGGGGSDGGGSVTDGGTAKVIAPPVNGPGADGTTAEKFTGPASGTAPQVVYPFDGVLLARNINQMRLAFSAAAGQKFFRVVVDSPTYQQTFYLGAAACQGTKCSYLVDDTVWSAITRNPAQKATLTIAGTAGAGQPVGTTAPLGLRFSPQDVRGGLYYFSTSRNGLLRLPFGGTTAAPYLLGTGTRGDGVNYCVGCHTVSRDGKKVAAVFDVPDGYSGIIDGADPKKFLLTPTAVQGDRLWNFATFNPDGSKLITAWKGTLSLRDGTTGALLSTINTALTGGRASMPEWSPDGMSIVFVRVPAGGKLGVDFTGSPYTAGDWILGDAGDIALLPYNNGNFGQATTVVSSTANTEYHFYPSFSPDSQWIVFNSATAKDCGSDSAASVTGLNLSSAHCVSYDQTAARLRLVKAAANQTPIELAAATHLAQKTSAWPKFAPFQQGSLVFFTYSAKFDYGFVVQQESIKAVDGTYRPQIWMSAIDLSKAAAEKDPSFPPFWLPFQDSATNNHEVLWTQDVACMKAADCGDPAQFNCVAGVCVPTLG